jgi:hypothetical protein
VANVQILRLKPNLEKKCNRTAAINKSKTSKSSSQPGNILDDASDNTFSADYRDDNTNNNATSFSPTI